MSLKNRAFKVLLALSCGLAYLNPVMGSERPCRAFTAQQVELIHLAYKYGEPDNLGYTLSAIVIQESFVGDYVVKMFPDDGLVGSYGITHIYLTTAMYYENVSNRWEALQDIAPKLIANDEYSLELSVKKLKTYWVNHPQDDWRGLWRSYNGKGRAAEEYSMKIEEHIKGLESCFELQATLESNELLTSNWELPSFIPYQYSEVLEEQENDEQN